MRLKFKISAEAFNALDQSIQALYGRNENGEYILQVEGAVDRSKLDEFRDNNVELKRQLEAFGGLKPEEIEKIVEDRRKIQEKEWLEKGEVDKIVDSRVATMKDTYERQINELKESSTHMSRQLETLTIDNVVRENAIKLGVTPTAVDDVLFRARSTYSLVEGIPTPKDREGKVIYGKDGAGPMPIGEFVSALKTTAPHLFGPSTGTGGQGSIGVGGMNSNKNATPTSKISAGLQGGSKILE